MPYPPEIRTNNIQFSFKTPKDLWSDPRAIDTGAKSYIDKFFTQDFRPNTRKALRSDFQHFIIWYIGTNKEPFTFHRLTESDVVGYKQSCISSGNAPSTINRRITHLRMLCAFAVQEKRLKENYAQKVKLLPLQPLAPKSLNQSDLRKIIKEIEIRKNLRDRVVIALMAGAGLRVSELAALKIEDIRMSDRQGHAVIRNSKGGKTREVPLNNTIRMLLSQLLANKSPNEHVFIGQRGPLTTNAFNKIVDFYAKKAGVRCHPHQFRHTFAYNFLAQNQNDLVALAAILGHSDVKITARYAQNGLSQLQEKVENMSSAYF